MISRLLQRALFTVGPCATLVLAGCTVTLRAPAERPTMLPSGQLGRSQFVAMPGPRVAAVMGDTDPLVYPEARRNNDNLAYRPQRALTALDSWPQEQVPSLIRRRTLFINNSPQQFIFFAPAPDGGRLRGSSRGYSSGYNRFGY